MLAKFAAKLFGWMVRHPVIRNYTWDDDDWCAEGCCKHGNS